MLKIFFIKLFYDSFCCMRQCSSAHMKNRTRCLGMTPRPHAHRPQRTERRTSHNTSTSTSTRMHAEASRHRHGARVSWQQCAATVRGATPQTRRITRRRVVRQHRMRWNSHTERPPHHEWMSSACRASLSRQREHTWQLPTGNIGIGRPPEHHGASLGATSHHACQPLTPETGQDQNIAARA